MGRFILRYIGPGPLPEADVARIRDTVAGRVVEATPRMLVVDADADSLAAVVDGLADWIAAPDQGYEVPDTRAKVERPPD